MRRGLSAVLIGVFLCGLRARAEAPAPTSVSIERSGPLLAAIDPLERARVVATIGDAQVLAWVAGQDGASVALQLAAVRSSPFLAEPAAALEPLVALLGGRDPDLAPSAASALERIAERLALEEPACGACSPEALGAAADALAKLSGSPRVRSDLRLRALTASAQLSIARERL